MAAAPVACTVHDGHGMPPAWRRKLIAAWLTANDVTPENVSADHPISVLTVPFRPEETADGGPWMLQVIVLNQYYVNANGSKEQNLITRKPVTYQRTVPLKVPFPADTPSGDEGATRGQADQQAAQEASQEQVRPARSAPLPDRHKGEGSQRTRQGSAERIEVDAEDHPRPRHEAVPEPEEDRRRPEEEVAP